MYLLWFHADAIYSSIYKTINVWPGSSCCTCIKSHIVCNLCVNGMRGHYMCAWIYGVPATVLAGVGRVPLMELLEEPCTADRIISKIEPSGTTDGVGPDGPPDDDGVVVVVVIGGVTGLDTSGELLMLASLDVVVLASPSDILKQLCSSVQQNKSRYNSVQVRSVKLFQAGLELHSELATGLAAFYTRPPPILHECYGQLHPTAQCSSMHTKGGAQQGYALAVNLNQTCSLIDI